MKSLRATYDRIAEDWHQDHQSDDWWVEGTERFISYLQPGAHILDVGCASGVKSRYLIERGFRVTGIDFSEKLIEIARREVPTGVFLVMDLADISTLPEEFDGIFLQAVLLHIPKNDVHTKLKTVVGKLKPGGYVYVAVKEGWPGQLEEEILVEDDYGYRYERFFSYFTLPEMKEHFQAVGLETVFDDIMPSGKTRWIQIIGRKPG